MTRIALPATLAATLLATSAGVAAAQPSDAGYAPAPAAPAPAAEKDDSLNVSPLGLLFGNFYLTYEKLYSGTHGLVVDAGFGRSANDGSNELHGAVGVGYRWHWSHRQDSGFLGVMVHQSVGAGNVSYEDAAGERSYDMNVRSTMITGNIGKRWMIGDQFNVTLRFGLGWGHHTATYAGDDASAEAKMAEQDMNDLLSLIPIGVDGELSVGYNF